MSANWFTKKLGSVESPSTPSTSPQVPSHQPAPNAAPASPQAPPQALQGTQGAQGAQNFEEASAAFQAWMRSGNTRGGQAHKSGKVGECPGCGSGNYLELKNGSSCFDCGYPLIQFGSELGEGNQQ